MTGLEVLCNHGVLSGAIFSPLNMMLNSGPGWCNTRVMHGFDSPDVDGRPCASEAAPPLLGPPRFGASNESEGGTIALTSRVPRAPV